MCSIFFHQCIDIRRSVRLASTSFKRKLIPFSRRSEYGKQIPSAIEIEAYRIHKNNFLRCWYRGGYSVISTPFAVKCVWSPHVTACLPRLGWVRRFSADYDEPGRLSKIFGLIKMCPGIPSGGRYWLNSPAFDKKIIVHFSESKANNNRGLGNLVFIFK